MKAANLPCGKTVAFFVSLDLVRLRRHIMYVAVRPLEALRLYGKSHRMRNQPHVPWSD